MTSPELFWPTNYFSDFWPYRYWQLNETTAVAAAPDFKIYKKIVASPQWGSSWQ